MSVSEAESKQRGHGGLNSRMKDKLGKTGTITDIDSDGDVTVFGYAWNPELVEKISSSENKEPSQNLSEGDTVRIKNVSVSEAESKQREHGRWTSGMEEKLGKTGTITDIDSDGDVKVCGYRWNQELVEKISRSEDEPVPSSKEDEELLNILESLFV